MSELSLLSNVQMARISLHCPLAHGMPQVVSRFLREFLSSDGGFGWDICVCERWNLRAGAVGGIDYVIIAITG